MAEWPGKQELLNTMRASGGRAMAYLTGSAMSQHDGLGVPTVKEYIAIARLAAYKHLRDGLTGFDEALAGFDEAVGRKKGDLGAQYREAMHWLGENVGKDAVDQVVRNATARAHIPPDHQRDPDPAVDNEPSHWVRPPGCQHLAELLLEGGDRFFGPVLTTNFDPLMEHAVRAAKGRVARVNITGDERIRPQDELEPDTVRIVYLHGFWSEPGTLHTERELDLARPRLGRALQELLVEEKRALLAVGYGGWEDVFTRSLLRFIQEGDVNELDIRWCFYEKSEAEVRQKYPLLIDGVEEAIRRQRFRPYLGIDCHTVFGELLDLERRAAAAAAPAPRNREQAPVRIRTGVGARGASAGGEEPVPPRWERIDKAFLEAQRALNRDELVRYFDGAMPTWRHAVCESIPCREAVREIVARLEATKRDQGGGSLQIVLGAGAEGTSTVLLQAAAAAVREGGWTVFWRPDPDSPLDPDAVAGLEEGGGRWLVVADDADNLLPGLRQCAKKLHESGRSDVHLLIGASSSMWASAGGSVMDLGDRLKPHEDIRLAGASLDECRAIIREWAKCGDAGLGALANAGGSENDWALTLQQQITDTSAGRSLYGALLTLRFDRAALRAHAKKLLGRLDSVKVGKRSYTLRWAMAYVAAAHAGGLDGLDRRVLAELVGVPNGPELSRVLRSLAEEAAGTRRGNMVYARHLRVADEIVSIVDEAMDPDIASACADIVRQTVQSAHRAELDRRWVGGIRDAGPRLLKGLKRMGMSAARRGDAAIAAAKALKNAEPGRLQHVVTVGRVCRDAGRFDDALALFAEELEFAPETRDFSTCIRGYCYEWGVNAGLHQGQSVGGLVENVWLAGLSLCDQLEADDLTMRRGPSDRIGLSSHGLGQALERLVRRQPDPTYARALAAVGEIGCSRPHEDRTEDYAAFKAAGTSAGAQQPVDTAQAVSWVREAVALAGRSVSEPAMCQLVSPDKISFGMLLEALTREAAGADADTKDR